MYRFATFGGFGQEVDTRRSIPVVASTGAPAWKEIYDGSVKTSNPSERTVRFVMDYINNKGYTPSGADITFDQTGEMELIEVYAPYAGPGSIAAVSQPYDKVTIPVDIYQSEKIRTFNFNTSYLRESSILFLNAWIASRYHWSDKYGYGLYKPIKVVMHVSAQTGRPDRIKVSTSPASTTEAGVAKYQYEQLYAAK